MGQQGRNTGVLHYIQDDDVKQRQEAVFGQVLSQSSLSDERRAA